MEYIEEGEKMTSNEEKVEAVLTHYKQATDKNNALRDQFVIAPEMNGTIASKTQSYALEDN